MNSTTNSSRKEDLFLSLIVPVYNEENRLQQSIPCVSSYLAALVARYELIYVDDGSTDGTHEALSKAAAGCPHMRVIRHDRNRGKGQAIRTGFQAASGDILLFSDADFSTPITDAPRLLAKIREDFRVVIGSRALPTSNVEVHQSWVREEMGKTFNLIVKALLPLPFSDTQCGFKMFTRQAAQTILPRLHVDRFAFDVEMLTVAWLHGIPMTDVGVTWRNVRESKVHPIRDSMRMIRDILGIRYRLALGLYD